MPRGGRRRRGRKGRGRSPSDRQGAKGEQKAKQPAQVAEGGPARRRRRRRRGGREGGMASMIHRPTKLETLPPDGVVLEELISNLQDEYGTPVTPQEFRLTIKMSPADESPGGPAKTDDRDVNGASPDGIRRRRRRSRIRGAEVTQITAEPEDPEDPQEIPPT